MAKTHQSAQQVSGNQGPPMRLFQVNGALSSSPATASRSRWRVSTCPAVSKPCSRLRAVRTASRNVRARVRPASSGAVAARRSADPRAWIPGSTQRSSRQRPGLAIPPAATRGPGRGRTTRLRPRLLPDLPATPGAAVPARRSGTATATASMTAASSHHNPPVASLVSAADPGAGGDGVGDGVGAASAGSVEGRFGSSVVVMVWVGGSGRVNDRVGLGGSAVWVGDSGRVVDRVRSGTVALRLGVSPPTAMTSPTAGLGLHLLRTR